jgi:hypothetical protein
VPAGHLDAVVLAGRDHVPPPARAVPDVVVAFGQDRLGLAHAIGPRHAGEELRGKIEERVLVVHVTTLVLPCCQEQPGVDAIRLSRDIS